MVVKLIKIKGIKISVSRLTVTKEWVRGGG
jgi:hypothetical protein